MDMKIVTLYFKIGKWLSLTPSSVENRVPTTFQKLDLFITFTFYTVGVMYSLYERTYIYQTLPKVQLCLRIIMDIVMVFKRRRWFVLVKNLTMTCTKIKKRRHHLSIFILTQVIFCASGVLIASAWMGIVGIDFLKEFLVEDFQIYSLFVYVTFACFILTLLLERYRHQCYLLLERSHRPHKQSIRLDEVRRNLFFLKEAVVTFNDIFGWTILLTIFFVSARSLMHLDVMIKNTYHKYESNNSIWNTLHFVSNMIMIFIFWVSSFLFNFQSNLVKGFRLDSWRLFLYVTLYRRNLKKF
jgi:hypothetical protein